jgi:hypothetical protein
MDKAMESFGGRKQNPSVFAAMLVSDFEAEKSGPPSPFGPPIAQKVDRIYTTPHKVRRKTA